MKKVDSALKEALEKIKPSEKETESIRKKVRAISDDLKERIKKDKIDAEVFVGGSLAKNTMIRKGKYDVDLFIRFDKKYEDREISKITEKLLKGINKTKIHGSRDYFSLNIDGNFFIEIIPVKKIKNPREAENITDLSYSHVNYIKKKLKTKKILDEARLAKAFCYANNCYGAESYVKGFSGYGIELLIYKYGSFVKFARAMINAKGKIVIDLEKQFKNKKEIMMDLNSAKLQSPVILIDPTYKQRNTLAALSHETFEELKNSAEEFLKNPSAEFFNIRKINFTEEKSKNEKKGFDAVIVEAETAKQEGDIAGSKLLKFYRHLSNEIERFFDINEKKFDYSGGKSAKFFFAGKRKKEIVLTGPYKKDEKNCKEFRKKHKKIIEKSGRLYAKEKVEFSLNDFIEKWKKKHSKRMNEMSVKKLKIAK